MFNNLNEFSEYLWEEKLKKAVKIGIISIDDILLLRNISVELKDKEKLKGLFELVKMIDISLEPPPKELKKEKKQKILKLLDDDIKSETWGDNVFNI